MDLLAPCRSCLRCLPIFQVSPPPSPRARPTTTTTSTASAVHADPDECSPSFADTSPQDLLASDKSKEPHPPPLPCSSFNGGSENSVTVENDPSFADTSPQDLLASDKSKEPHPPPLPCSSFNGGSENSVTVENDPVSEIITIAPPVSSSPPSKISFGASSRKNPESNKPSSPPPELPLHVPFINDISFSTGILPLSSPMTPAPFGTGYGYPAAGQYHPSPHIYPPGSDHSHGKHAPLQEHRRDSHAEHGDSHDGHDLSHHVHDDSNHGHGSSHYGHDHAHHLHDDSNHGHSSSDHGHGPLDESHAHEAPENTAVVKIPDDDVPDVTHDTSLLALEASNSMPVDLDAEHEGENGDSDAIAIMGGDSALIQTYHSEPIAPSEVFEDDEDSYILEEDLGHNALHLGRRRRRRDHFKEQFKGISQHIKKGGLHIKEEGSKHLQTIISNVNKQAQQIEQSGSFFIVPRANNK